MSDMTLDNLATKVEELQLRGYGHFKVRVKNQNGHLRPITGFYSIDEYDLLDIMSDEEEGE